MASTIAGVTGRRFSIAIWCQTSTPIPEREDPPNAAASHSSTLIFKERFNTIERVFGWEDKFRRLLLRFERLSQLH